MHLTRNDASATVVTLLAVLVYAASASGTDVWLVGPSHRWAALAILLLGIRGCMYGSASQEPASMDGPTKVLAAIGVGSLVAAAATIVTGSIVALDVLVACVVALWLGATARHATAHVPAGKS
jgi:hypothetical protein